MDNKYTDIIDVQAPFFKYFLQKSMSLEMREILNKISAKTDVYVFSGIIRNFFLGDTNFRDLDIVVRDVDCVMKIMRTTKGRVDFKVNSFGGVKVKFQNLIIDLWGLSNTWGIKKENMDLSPHSLLKTAFFNFSAIVFDYNNTKFYYDNAFVDFLETKIMDVVYLENPNIPLCIINSCYYREKYGFGLSLNLCRWLFVNYIRLAYVDKRKSIFDDLQKKHFSKIVVSHEQIRELVYLCYRHIKIVMPISPKFI